MKNPIIGLNKVFESRIRLGVMSTLMVNEDISFNDLKQMLEVTDGNRVSHLVNLEENGLQRSGQSICGQENEHHLFHHPVWGESI